MRTLKKVTIPLFLLSYFLSSFLTTQYRTEGMARRVMRAAVGQHVQITTGNRASQDNYPRYREAKKAAFDFHFRSVASINLSPLIAEGEYGLLQLYWETHNSLRVSSVRAPPLQAQLHQGIIALI